MKHNYLFLCLFMLLPFVGVSQSIFLQESYTSFRCASTVMSVSFTTSGTFAAGNAFRVQLSANYGNTYVDLPGSFTSSPASVTLPTIPFVDTYYTYRIVADKPLTVSSSSSSFRIGTLPSAQLTGRIGGNIPVNPYTTVYLRMAVTGGAAYTLTMQDSTQFVKTNEYLYENDFPVAPARSTTFALARVQNACGTGTVSGSATVPVNTVGFQLLNRASENACLGTVLPVYFSTSSPLPANATFEAELISTYDGNRAITIPVSGSASPLQVALPSQYIGSSSSGYQLRIYSKNAGVSAWYRDGNTFTLDSPPRFSLTASPSSVPFGGQTSLTLSYTTTSSGEVFLSDGRQVSVYGSGGYGSSTQFTVNPVATTSYSIVAYTGTCADGIAYGNKAATVQVRPGLRIDSLSTSEICAGLPITLYYTATPGYSLPSQVRVRYGEFFYSQATQPKPGQLVFTPPTSLTPSQSRTIQVRHDPTDTLLAEAPMPLLIRNKPLAYWAAAARTMSSPGQLSLEAWVVAGGTTTLVLNTGERFMVSTGYSQGYSGIVYLPVYVAKTTAYSIVSATNECGTVQGGSAPMTVNVTNNLVPLTGLTILSASPTTYNFCPGSREWINVFPTGIFNADNQFQLEISGSNGVFGGTSVQSFSSVTAMSFVLPASTGTYRVRVSSTSPSTRSNEQTFTINSAPTASVSISLPNGSSGSLTTVSGQLINATYSFSNGRSPYQYEFANGPKGRSDYGFQTMYQPTVTTNYSIVKVTDACGVTATVANPAATVVVVPTLLRTGFINVAQVCIQTPVPVPFTQFGSVPASVSYVVQFSEDQLAWETAPTSGTTSPLTVNVPASLAGKQVFYRVAYLANGVLVSGIRYADRVQIRTTPNTVLSTPNNATTVQIDRANSSSSELRLIDLSGDATVVVSNGQTTRASYVYASGTSYYISQPGTYSIVSVYNSCGYGKGQGVVRATVKPYLTLARASRTTACLGQAVSFSYAAAGDFDAGNKLYVYLIDNYGNAKTLLTETTSLNGVVSVSLSPALKASSYSIQIESSAPVSTLYGVNLNVDAPVSASLVAFGPGVVYEGERQTLSIVTNLTGGFSATIATPMGLSVVNSSYSQYFLDGRITQSGSYSLLSASSQCGVGRASGGMLVTVLPASSVTIRPNQYNPLYCTGKRYSIYFNTTGVFSTTNTFTAYLADSTGVTVRTLATLSSPGELTVTIPVDLPASNSYMLRIGSSSPVHLGASTYANLFTRQSPTATLTGNSSIIKGDSVRLSVALTGTPPWQFVLTDFFGPRTFNATTSPYTLTVRPDTTSGYRLTEVRNDQCGTGTATGTALITVTKILATEPALSLQVRTWPNPTAGTVLIEGDVPGNGDVRLVLHTLTGSLVSESVGVVRQGRLAHRLDLSQLPTGIYLLTAEQDGRRGQFKVVKQ